MIVRKQSTIGSSIPTFLYFFQAKQRLKIKENLCPDLHLALMLRCLKHTITIMVETISQLQMVEMTCMMVATRYEKTVCYNYCLKMIQTSFLLLYF